jgi:hypothetical protein
MRLLARMVGERFGWLNADALAESLEMAQTLLNQATSLNRNAFLHPEWPDLSTRGSGPVFAMLDMLSSRSAPAEAFVSALENFRAASMGYWLAAAPPLPSEVEQLAAAGLIEKEQRLLMELKGAYFLILAPTLPMHYRRAAREIDPNDPSSLKYPDTGKGLGHFKRIREELADLHSQMEQAAPEYAKRCLSPAADVSRLSQALGMHRKPVYPSEGIWAGRGS